MPETSFHPPICTISKEQLALKIVNKEPIEIINIIQTENGPYGGLLIKGSKTMFLADVESHLADIDKNKPIVAYTALEGRAASYKAAEIFMRHGFRAWVYEGNLTDWKESGLPME